MKESQMSLFSIISNILAKEAFIMNANNSGWIKSKTPFLFSIKRLRAQSYKVCLALFISIILAGCGNDSGNDNSSNDKAALKTIIAGGYHSFALFDNGKVYATGQNDYGQLGLGDNVSRSNFTEVTDLNDKNITAVFAGTYYSFALSFDGRVYVAGQNDNGQLGLGDNDNRTVFTEVFIP